MSLTPLSAVHLWVKDRSGRISQSDSLAAGGLESSPPQRSIVRCGTTVWREEMAFVSTGHSLTQSSLKQQNPRHHQTNCVPCSAVLKEERENSFLTAMYSQPCMMPRARLLHKCRFGRILHLLQNLRIQSFPRGRPWQNEDRKIQQQGISPPARRSVTVSLHAC